MSYYCHDEADRTRYGQASENLPSSLSGLPVNFSTILCTIDPESALLKLRWWSPDEASVIDLHWNRVPDTNLIELLVEPDGELPLGVRVLFFEHSPNSVESTLWVLGGLIIGEEFSELQREVYLGRSLIVQERSD